MATPPTGWVVIDNAAAAPAVMLKFDEVTDPKLEAVKVRLWFVATRPARVAALNVATPDTVFTDVVPPIVPVPDETVTAVEGCADTALPPASTTVTAGDPATTPPDVPPVGCVDTFNADAAPNVNVKLLLVAVG